MSGEKSFEETKFEREVRKRRGKNKRRGKERMGKRISRTVYRKKGKAHVVETNSKIDVGERTCNLYLG